MKCYYLIVGRIVQLRILCYLYIHIYMYNFLHVWTAGFLKQLRCWAASHFYCFLFSFHVRKTADVEEKLFFLFIVMWKVFCRNFVAKAKPPTPTVNSSLSDVITGLSLFFTHGMACCGILCFFFLFFVITLGMALPPRPIVICWCLYIEFCIFLLAVFVVVLFVFTFV